MTTEAAERPEVASEVVDRAEFKDGAPIVAYSRTEQALAALRQRLEGAKFDLTTTAGDKAARAARLELVTLRTELEKRRKAFKAPALEFGRLIDAEAERIRLQIEVLEKPIDEQIRADEKRREEERQAREAAERERVLKLRQRLDYMRGVAARAAGKPSTEVRAKLDLMLGITIGEDFAEFREEARTVHAEVTQQLREMLAAVEAQEAEAARLRAEREAMQAKAAEDSLVASIHAAAVLVEQESTPYIQKAITAFESAVKAWEPDARERVAHAIASGRSQLTARLAAAQERERIAAEQAAEAQRLAAERAALAEREATLRAAQEAPKNIEGPGSQQVLKAEPATADATDRDAPAVASPSGGSMGAGQAAAAAPAAGLAPPAVETISQNAEESGSSPADAPAPGDAPGMCASAGPEASNGSVIAGDEGPVAQEVLRAADPAPEPEQPTIKLGDLCAEVGDGFKMTEAFVSGTLSVHCTKGERGAVLYTRTQRRQALLSLRDRLNTLAAA